MTVTDGRRIGPYLLGALLGSGGMGEVYRAVDTEQGGRPVALKLLSAHLSADEAYRARFRREAEIAARLDNPHVVPIHRYGESGGRLFLDMQLVEGPDLATVVGHGGRMHPWRAVAIIEQVASALDAAHRHGLVHRDVKPANVLLHQPGPHRPELALLTDFGLTAEGSATDGELHGTIEYLAPERLTSAPTDHRVDVYALGCTLFELLTGLRAFPGGDFAAQAHGHLRLPPPRPSQLVAGLPPGLDDVVVRAMAKNPAERYPSAGALAAAARAALDTAGRAGTRRPSRRTVLVAGAAGVTLLGAGLGASLLAGGPGPATPQARGPRGIPPRPVVTERALGVRAEAIGLFGLVIGAVDGHVAVALTDLDTDSIRVWDVVEDRALLGLPPDMTASITMKAISERSGRPVLFTAPPDTSAPLDLYDIRTGQHTPRVFEGHTGGIDGLATTVLDGRHVVVTSGREQQVRIRYVDDGAPVRPPMPMPGTVSLLRVVALGGVPMLITRAEPDYLNPVEVRDLRSGEVTYQLSNAFSEITELDGRPVEVVRSPLGYVEVIDLPDRLGPRRFATPGVEPLTTAFTVVDVDDRPLAIIGGSDGALLMWDVATGERVGAPLTGHPVTATALATGHLDGRPVLVSLDKAYTVRVWDLAVRVAS